MINLTNVIIYSMRLINTTQPKDIDGVIHKSCVKKFIN